jgi:3-oxoacyl-[acyl-carrier protein] reductase
MALATADLYASAHPRYPELAGQVAIVTGSSRGIGRGIVARLAREGMRVVITSRTPKAVERTTDELCALGAEALGVVADLSRSTGIQRLVDRSLEAFGTVDLLVNNAADLRRVPLFEIGEDMLGQELAINIRAPFLLSQRVAAVMRRAGQGNIIHISSVGGLRAHRPALPYDATKGAIDALTRGMALDLAPFGIRVNAVAPGPVHTERWLAPEHPHAKAVAGRVPLGRFATVLEIGAAVAFLASPEAAYITGQVLYVDGGITAQLSPPGVPV